MNVINIDNGQREAIDPFKNLIRQSSADEERDARLSGLVAGFVARRGVLTRAKQNDTKLMNTGGLAIGDVSIGVPLDTAVTPNQSDAFIASMIAPVVEVKRPVGSWWAQTITSETDPVIPQTSTSDGQVPEVQPVFSHLDFSCQTVGLACRIGKQLEGTADFDVLAVAALRLAHAHAMRWELCIQQLLTTSANWNASCIATLGATAKWNAGSTSSALTDIWARRASSTLPCDTIVLSESVEQYLYTQSSVRDFNQAGGHLPDVIVGRAKNGANNYVWPTDKAILVRRPKSPTDFSTCRTFRWPGGAAPSTSRVVDGFSISTQFIQSRGSAGEIFMCCSVADSFKMITSPTATQTVGGLILSVVQ